jgi:hypothetical protein
VQVVAQCYRMVDPYMPPVSNLHATFVKEQLLLISWSCKRTLYKLVGHWCIYTRIMALQSGSKVGVWRKGGSKSSGLTASEVRLSAF